MFSSSLPLVDITNYQFTSAKSTLPTAAAPKVHRHDPYGWKCLMDEDDVTKVEAMHEAAAAARQAAEAVRTAQPRQLAHRLTTPATPIVVPKPQELFTDNEDHAPAAPPGQPVCTALVQFKCHQAEFSSCIAVERGQYVVVQGDRGIDIGVVTRVNDRASRAYVEKTGPQGSVLRFASQKEVDYWATELKEAEMVAVAFCKNAVYKSRLDMDVVQAEYQFDKKKLTFYYEARARIDFVQLLKDLYREFGCRIWMEKVRTPE